MTTPQHAELAARLKLLETTIQAVCQYNGGYNSLEVQEAFYDVVHELQDLGIDTTVPPTKRTITLTVNGREWVLPEPLRDALIDQIESAAKASFQRHRRSIGGQILTAADNYDWHLLHAAYQAGIHALRAQLAEAQKDAELGRVLRQAAKDLPTYFVISVNVERGAGWVELGDRYGHITEIAQEDRTLAEQVRAAIDAAKGESNG